MKDYTVVKTEDLEWRPSNLMKIPNADFLERTGSEMMGARLWRLPPKSAMTLHKHHRKEEFYFVVEGRGRIRIDEATITLEAREAVHVSPQSIRQVFNDTDEAVTWLIVGAPEAELDPAQQGDLSVFYPRNPTELPPELEGVDWPPRDR